MVEQILAILRKSGQTVATAESITAGQVQTRLGSVSGSSDVFLGGITAYQRSVKVEQLGVDDALARKTDCVDEEIARQMALGALQLFHSDFALATCGYAERDHGSPYAFYAIAQAPASILFSARIDLSGSRIDAQRQATTVALEKFLELLCNKSCDQ